MNITEFAQYAGVSKAAVSRYFNGGYLGADKRALIEAAVEATGYHPSMQAQMLRTRRTRQVGVILPKLSSDSCPRIVEGIGSVLEDSGYQLLLINTANDPQKELRALDTLHQRTVDGILLIATVFTPEHKAVLERLHSPLVGYQGHVIPVIIAVWLMCQIEKRLHKVVPAMFDLFVTPLVSVFVTGYLTLAAIGPVFTKLENSIITGVQALITLPYGIGSFIMGGLYAITVVAGIHHMYTLIDLGQLARYGYTYWLPLASAANVAQGGAALAVALKSKDTKVKSMALPSALSACMGITEPAIFGVNLRYFKPFLGGLLGGACGALYASIVGLGATGTGVTGIFGILLHLHMPLQYIIMMAISFGVSFAVTWVIWKPEEVKA